MVGILHRSLIFMLMLFIYFYLYPMCGSNWWDSKVLRQLRVLWFWARGIRVAFLILMQLANFSISEQNDDEIGLHLTILMSMNMRPGWYMNSDVYWHKAFVESWDPDFKGTHYLNKLTSTHQHNKYLFNKYLLCWNVLVNLLFSSLEHFVMPSLKNSLYACSVPLSELSEHWKTLHLRTSWVYFCLSVFAASIWCIRSFLCFQKCLLKCFQYLPADFHQMT